MAKDCRWYFLCLTYLTQYWKKHYNLLVTLFSCQSTHNTFWGFNYYLANWKVCRANFLYFTYLTQYWKNNKTFWSPFLASRVHTTLFELLKDDDEAVLQIWLSLSPDLESKYPSYTESILRSANNVYLGLLLWNAWACKFWYSTHWTLTILGRGSLFSWSPRLDLTEKDNIWLLVCSEAVESILVKLEMLYSNTSTNGECCLLYLKSQACLLSRSVHA